MAPDCGRCSHPASLHRDGAPHGCELCHCQSYHVSGYRLPRDVTFTRAQKALLTMVALTMVALFWAGAVVYGVLQSMGAGSAFYAAAAFLVLAAFSFGTGAVANQASVEDALNEMEGSDG